jgi:hypothetical protein
VFVRHRAARSPGDHERGCRDPCDDVTPSRVGIVDLRSHLLDHPPVEPQDAGRWGGAVAGRACGPPTSSSTSRRTSSGFPDAIVQATRPPRMPTASGCQRPS